jgi:hypothetical protein
MTVDDIRDSDAMLEDVIRDGRGKDRGRDIAFSEDADTCFHAGGSEGRQRGTESLQHQEQVKKTSLKGC